MKTSNPFGARMQARLLALVCVVFGVLQSSAACGATAAMVTDLQGRATITSAGKSRDATILSDLEANARVQLDAGATLVALYLDGGNEYVFKGPAAIVFAPEQPEMVSGARPDRRNPALGTGVRIKPVGMAQGATVLRSLSVSARIRLLTLSGTRVLETQPEFIWQALQPGIQYRIDISDDTGRLLHEAQVETTSFRLPPGLQLKEGASYTWEVSTRLPDGRKYSSAGDFHVAGTDLRAQAASLRLDAAAPVSSRVAYAAWLDQMELRDEARKYWRALSADRPDDARLKALADE